MGLKQSIVIKNQFTIKDKFGGGSRGKTPGKYVSQYMLRNSAVEDLTPTKLKDEDSYTQRLLRKENIVNSHRSLYKVRNLIDKNDKLSGIAFGRFGNSSLQDISMSDENVRRMEKKIQNAFDNDKTILKTVLSFDEDYLKEMGIVKDDFSLRSAGDYKGNIDQLKLRNAICDGLNKMGKNFDNLNYIGCLQVDTAHVHAHLCMFDEGVGRLVKNGEQVGKLNERDKGFLRRGVDMSLGFSKNIKHLSSNYAYTKSNSKSYVKKYTHRVMKESGLSQLLIASLPEDKSLWRASSNNKEMKAGNSLVKFYVKELLKRDDSGYDEAKKAINEYAFRRYERENLSDKEYRKLIKNGNDRLVNDCMNGVYQVLKIVGEKDKKVHTKILDYFTTDYNMISNIKDINYNSGFSEPDKLLEFSFKLRSYSTRLEYHKNKKNKNYENQKAFKDAEKNNQVTADAYAMLNFYTNEKQYHEMLMSKYQYFLKFLPIKDSFKKDFDKLSEDRKKVYNFKTMLSDDTFNRFKNEENAEDYAKKVYDISGGRYMVLNRTFSERSYSKLYDRYQRDKDDFRERLRDNSLYLEDEDTLKVSTKDYYDFDEVKALDLHHLEYDFYEDVYISKFNIDNFSEMANKRYKLYNEACDYLSKTGQKDEIKNLDGDDIKLMYDYAKSLSDDGLLKSLKSGEGYVRKTKTIPLNEYLDKDLENVVKSTVTRVADIEDRSEFV